MARRSSGSGCLVLVVLLAGVGWMANNQAQAKSIGLFALVVGGVAIAIPVARSTMRKRRIRAKYDPETAKRIIARMTWQGQTAEQLVDALGQPADVDQAVMKSKTREVWKYGRTGKNRYRTRITLEDGAVVGWEMKGG
jgi:hypothetical protein